MKAYVFSGHMSDYALYRGARELGISVFTHEKFPLFPIPYAPKEARGGEDWLLLIEEASLSKALSGKISGKFLPPSFPSMLLDDKWLFAKWLEEHPSLIGGLKQWSLDERQKAVFPCLLKAKHSWLGALKLPRGWVCYTLEDVEAAFRKIEALGVSQEHFFLQEWLGDRGARVISVCGFHDAQDPGRNLTAVVERIAAQKRGLSCSAAIETIEDRWELVQKAQKILDTLGFCGPYEMEFLVLEERAFMLELNPRFWIQHSLFFLDGNGLLKRYFGIETAQDRAQKQVHDLVWIDGVQVVLAPFRLRFLFLLQVIKIFLTRQRVVVWPSLPMAAYGCLRWVLKAGRAVLRGQTLHQR